MTSDYRLALITGGSSGIGFALAKALVLKGTDVCILARDTEKLSSAKEKLLSFCSGNYPQIDTLSCDITNFDLVQKSINQWTKKRGVPDLLINSAGVTYPGYFEELDIDIFSWLMDVNYFGTLHVIKTLIPEMIKRRKGTIVNISSQAGFVGVFGYSAYSASKYAVRGFSDVLRSEMKPFGINISVVFPPDTQTPQLDFEAPLKPIETKEIASSSGVMSADKVAAEILKGIQRNQYLILPGLEGKIFFRLTNILGRITYPIMDLMVRKAQKKKLKQ